MMTSVVTITCFLFIAQVMSVAALSCGDDVGVTATANCSFEVSEPCAETYRTPDIHGLKWDVNTGPIQTVDSVSEYDLNRYSYGYIYTTYLSNSNFNRYAYIRGTEDSRRWGVWTDMTSPAFKVYGGCLQYIVHNSVCGTPNDPAGVMLKVKLRSSANGKEESLILREYACINDSNWYQTKVSLHGITGTHKLVFSAQHHRWTNQIIAVDHVIYSGESCSLRDDVNFEAGDCDWEAGDSCGYDTVPDVVTGMDWTIQPKSSVPDGVTPSDFQGSVLEITGGESDLNESFARVSLISPQVEVHVEGCLVLSYYSGRHSSDNDGLTALNVTWIKSTNQTGLLYEFPATLIDDWLTAFVPLPAGKYSLVFTAQLRLPYGELEHDMTAIDDIDIYKSSCDTIQCNPSVQRQCSNQYACSQQGTCIGSSLKHYSCQCASPYIGKSCQSSYTYDSTWGFSPVPPGIYG